MTIRNSNTRARPQESLSMAGKPKPVIFVADLSPKNQQLLIDAMMLVTDRKQSTRLMNIMTRAYLEKITLEAARSEINVVLNQMWGLSRSQLDRVLVALDEAIAREAADRLRAVDP